MDIDPLVKAVQSLNAEDAFRARLTPAQWRLIAPYLARRELRAGEVLIRQGERDRAMHLVEQGSLQVFSTPALGGRSRLSIQRAGAVLGEAGLFSAAAAPASVEAITPCVIWTLPVVRLDEMAQRAPVLAVEILRAAGALMQARSRTHADGLLAAV